MSLLQRGSLLRLGKWIRPEDLLRKGKHHLISGPSGSGKTHTMFLLLHELMRTGETALWRDNMKWEWPSLFHNKSCQLPVQIFAPDGTEIYKIVDRSTGEDILKPMTDQNPIIYFDTKKPAQTVLDKLKKGGCNVGEDGECIEHGTVNIVLYDSFTFTPEKFVAFWQHFFHELWLWKQEYENVLLDLAFFADEFNDLCFTPETIVLANPEPKAIAEIEKETKVLTHLGRSRIVEATHQRWYEGFLTVVRPRYSPFPIRMTPNHPVLTIDWDTVKKTTRNSYEWKIGKNDSILTQAQWVPAGLLSPTHISGRSHIGKHFLVIPRFLETEDIENMDMRPYFWSKKKYPNEVVEKAHKLHTDGVNQHKIARILKVPRSTIEYWLNYSPDEASPKTRRKVPNSIKVDGDLLRLIGYYLSEGHAAWNGVWFSFNADETDYIEDVSRIIQSKTFHHTNSISMDKYGSHCTAVGAYSQILRDFLKQFGTESHGKKILDWVMKLPSDKQTELIKGIWRGDGTKNEAKIYTVSRTLAYQIWIILLRLGILASIFYDKRGGFVISAVGEYVSDFAKVVGEPRLARNKDSRRSECGVVTKDAVIIPIRKMTREYYSGLVYNIGVKDDASYQLPFLTVHNCPGFKYALMDLHLKLATLIAFNIKKFRSEGIRVVAGTHHVAEIHPYAQGNFMFYIFKRTLYNKVPDFAKLFAGVISKLRLEEAFIQDEAGYKQLMNVDDFIRVRTFRVARKPLPEMESEVIPHEYAKYPWRQSLTIEYMNKNLNMSYSEIASILKLAGGSSVGMHLKRYPPQEAPTKL